MDWKDKLAALGTSLPDGPETPVAEETKASSRPADVIEIVYERKGRGGKPATILAGFTCSDSELKDVAARLKSRLATGGSARGGEILVQGDCRERVRTLLREMGYKTKG